MLEAPLTDLYRARELGLLGEPGPGGRWPPDTAAAIAHAWPQTAATVKAARDLGAVRSAGLLVQVTGLPVTAAHLTDLTARGLLTPGRRYRNRPMYRVTDLHALAADPVAVAQLTDITGASPPGVVAGCRAPPHQRGRYRPARRHRPGRGETAVPGRRPSGRSGRWDHSGASRVAVTCSSLKAALAGRRLINGHAKRVPGPVMCGTP